MDQWNLTVSSGSRSMSNVYMSLWRLYLHETKLWLYVKEVKDFQHVLTNIQLCLQQNRQR